MKRYLLFFLWLAISLTSWTGGGIAYAIEYISEIAVAASGSEQDAKKQLTDLNYKVIDRDLNDDAGGDYIYVGYKTSPNYADAITNLIVSVGKNATNDITIDNHHYTMAKCLNNFNGDLNRNAGGDYLYLKYTKDKVLAEPAITELRVVENDNSDLTYVSGYSNSTCKNKHQDLNDGAGGDYLYLVMKKNVYTGDYNILIERLDVENLGGGYYKFVIPVNARDTTRTLNSLSGDLSIQTQDKRTLFTLKCENYYGEDYLKDDNHQIPIEVTTGQVIDHWSFDPMPKEMSKCYIEDGDHRDQRTTAILWQAPKDFTNEGSSFYISGRFAVNATTKNEFSATIVASSPKESMSMDTPMVIDPFFNMESGEPGWTKVMIVSTNEMMNLGLIDATNGETRKLNLETTTKNFELDLKAFNETHQFVLLTVIKKTSILSNGSQDYGYSLASIPFTLKGLHRLQADGDISSGASYDYIPEDPDPEAAEGMLDGHRWIRFWKGGPRWLVADPTTVRSRDLSDIDPTKEIYSRYWRTATKEEIQSLRANTIPSHRYDNSIRDFIMTLTGKNAYQANSIDIPKNQFFAAAIPGQAPKDWEMFSWSQSPEDFYSFYFERLAGSVTIMAVVDEDLLCNYLFTPTLKWKVKRPHTDDILEDDTYLVERDFDPSFSYPDAIGNVLMSDTINANDLEYAHFKFIDDSEDRFNPKADTASLSYFSIWKNIPDQSLKKLRSLYYPAHFAYYRVSRSFVKSVWANNSDYELNWRVLNTIVQPSITEVQLEKGKSWETERTVKVTVKLENPYPWDLTEEQDSAAVHDEAIRQGFDRRLYQWNPKSKIRIVRYSPDDEHYNGKDEVEKTFVINGRDVKMDEKEGVYKVEIDDILSAPHTHYFYKAIIDTTGVNWPVSGPIEYVSTQSKGWTKYTDLSPVSNLEASRGTIQGSVNLSWEPCEDANRTFSIERRQYGTEAWVALDTISDCFYNDQTAPAGQVNEYRVTAHTTFRGILYHSTSVTAIGYNPYYGTIAGKVKLYNGYAMPGNYLTVNIVSNDSFDISEVKDRNDSTTIIMPGLHQQSFRQKVMVMDDGTYYCDSIPYLADKAMKYTVSIEGLNGVDFENAAGTKGSIIVDVTSKTYVHTNLDFTCNDVFKFDGDILYNGSTVPVADVSFTVNGVAMRDANGRKITSDSEGHFNLQIPKGMPIKLRAEKEDHRFVNDGYLVGDDSTAVIPIEGFTGKTLYDLTTIRLVGRIVGGERQAMIPLGLAMSHNNLGDDIRLELQLEGDNTSNIVYDLKNPEKDTRDTTFTQQVKVGSDYVDTLNTHALFQRKRILLYPNNETGEFCIDLFPVKYKITSISAKGYSSLTNEGEGYEVLDLSHSTDTMDVSNSDYLRYMKENGIKGDQSSRTTSYQATYQRVYHVPATVTLQQYSTNSAALSDLLGEKTIKTPNLEGIKNETTTAYTENDQVKYAFGYPVFRDLMKYRFRATVHEDFYYNNQLDRAPEIVMLEGGHLTVYNGLESAKTKVEAELNDKGQADFVLNVDNPCFTLTDTTALRSVNAEVEVHGYYYKAKAIRGFVLGEEDAGTEIMPLDEEIEVIDVLRDPYGTNSYAWRDKGTEYHWDKESKTVLQMAINASATFGGGQTWYIGMGMAEKSNWSATGTFSINIPISKEVSGAFGEYTMTLNERIETSSDPLMQGAMADVYIGRVDVSHLRETKAVSIIDSTSFSHLQNAISSGAVQVVKEGIDAQGNKCYLVVGKKLIIATDSIASTFAYSQKHILGTIIPQLEKRYSELVLSCTREEAEQLAQSTGMVRYYEDEDGTPQMAIPTYDYTGINEALKIQNTIFQWLSVIHDNEAIKREYVNTMEPTLQTYSVSNQPVEFSENVSAYYDSYDYWVNGGHVSISLGFGGGGKSNNRESMINRDSTKDENRGQHVDTGNTNDEKEKSKKDYGDSYRDGTNGKKKEASVGGLIVSASLGGLVPSASISATNHAYIKDLRNTGFKLDIQDNGYMDIDVYKRKGRLLLNNQAWNYVSSNTDHFNDFDDFDKTTVETGEYVYIYRGGAMRSPWFDADSSLVYTESGKRVPLGERPKKIDNPKIYIANPVASNIRRDDKALFSVRLTNETEFNGDPTSLKPIPLMLRLADNCNPLGVKVMMDGAPITDGRKFQLKPGETLTKTIEVARGDGYDFDDLGLVFHDETLTLRDTAKFSVHYTPESSPVTLTLPKDQWVMNTLSDRDEETGKYYLPVEITGFDIQYEEFDHIELQYKKQTEGESQWVNLCSFYHDPDLYEKASGVKQLINSSTISGYAFYGEKDPIEMRYDLRAVSFCRLGTGFITKSSNIASGIKDTRTPEVFGKPTPVNGILTYGDVISVPFNEPIAYNYLDKTANFSVRGFTNNSDANHSARLRFASEKDYAETKVKRSLKGSDFTLEMNVQVDKDNDIAYFFSMEGDGSDNSDHLYFLYYAQKDILLADADGKYYGSEPLSKYSLNIHDAMTHVGLIYCVEEQSYQFIAGNKAVPAHEVENPNQANSSNTGKITSQIALGGMKGYMADVRLWQRELNTYEIENLYSKKLTGNESDLLAWWPMDEAMGNVVADHANGADLDLYGAVWETPKGFSAHLDGKPLEIDPDIKLFQTAERQDFSLAFWFKVDQLDATQAVDSLVDLFTAGTLTLNDKGQGKMRIGFKHNKLELRTEGNTIEFGQNNDYVRNGQWHFLTLVTNHAENLATLFIDGQMVAETDADKIGYITGTPVSFGSKGYHGYIDEVSMWHLALPQIYINDIKTTALTGKEKELNVYMSFETDELQGDNLMKTVFSPLNQKVSETTGQIVGDVMFDASTVGQEETVHAPMKKDIGIENIKFTWTSTDNELQINLQDKDAIINHQRIDLVLRGVEDLQGNPMANPLMWSIYVNKNVLKWKDQTYKVFVPYGEGTTLNASWQNISGRVLNYTIGTGCHWLQPERTMGVANPLEESDVNLIISSGMAPGSYNAIVNLTDEDGLVSKLYLEVEVVAEDPNWEVTTSDKYAESMIVTAQVLTDEDDSKVVDTDERDIVAAFYNGICLGKANIQKKSDNSAYVYLTIHGSSDFRNGKLLFYLWDKSQGEIKRLKRLDSKDIRFCPDSVMGSHSDPVVLVYDTISIQTISLKKGWNWISFNLKPSYTQGVNHLFLDNTVFSNEDIIKSSIINSKMAEYSSRNKTWGVNGNTMPLSSKYVYQLYVHNPCTVQIEGAELSDSDRKLTFTKGWCNLPYLLKSPTKIRRAMSDYIIGDKAKPGTIIKSHDAFAVADVSGIWYGSLEYLRPGEGYFVNHLGETCEVQFINSNIVDGSEPEDSDDEPTRAARGESVANEYAGAMPIIATFSAEEEVMEGDMLVAYAYGKEVGRAEASELIRSVDGTDRNVYFLMVNAADGNAIRFAKERDGETLELTPRAIRFNATGIAGTLDHPFIIDFSPADDNETFDIVGRHYTDDEQLQKQRVYIINGEKQMSK